MRCLISFSFFSSVLASLDIENFKRNENHFNS